MSVNRNIFYTFLSQLPTQVLSFLSGLFLVNLIGAEGRGVYAIITADVDLFAFFLGFSVNNGIAYFIPNNKIAPRKMLGLSLVVILIGTVLMGVLLWSLYGQRFTKVLFPEGYDSQFYFGFVLAGFVLTMSNTLFSGLFQGLKRFRLINQISIFNAVFNFLVFGGGFGLAHYGYLDLGVKEALELTLLILGMNTLIWLVVYLREVRWVPDFRLGYKDTWVPFFSYIGPGHLSVMINFLNYRLDLWVIDHYYTSAEVGIYAIAVGLAQRLWLLPNAIVLVLLPHLSGKKAGESLQELKLLSRVNNTLVLFAILVAIPVSVVFFPLAYGSEFSASVLPFQLLLAGMFFSSLTKIFSTYLASCGLVRFNLQATVIGLVVTVVFDLWLIPIYGAVGAGLATTATYFSIWAYVYYQMRLNAGLGWTGFALMQRKDIDWVRSFLKGGKPL